MATGTFINVEPEIIKDINSRYQFRAWDIEDGFMMTGEHAIKFNGTLEANNGGDCTGKYIIMMYSGSMDANSAKIFEADILSVSNSCYYVVSFIKSEFRLWYVGNMGHDLLYNHSELQRRFIIRAIENNEDNASLTIHALHNLGLTLKVCGNIFEGIQIT